MTIRDRFIEGMAEQLFDYACGHIDTKWSLIDPVYKVSYLNKAKQFLSIKLDDRYRLAIVDDKGELPEYRQPNYMVLGDEGRRDWDNKKIGMRAVQEDMLRQNYKKEIV